MKIVPSVALFLAVATVIGLTGCEGDPSAPRKPRTQLTPLAPDEKARDNAEKRQLEPPQRELPTGGKEYPGQSKAAPSEEPTVITAGPWEQKGPAGRMIPTNGTDAKFGGRIINIGGYQYPGPLAPLPDNPGSEPLRGTARVPFTPWTVDNSWGQGMLLQNYPHRDWPQSQTTYMAAVVKHNPVYYTTLQGALPVAQNDGSYRGNWGSNLYEVPWFYLQTPIVPVLMLIECPLSQVTTQRLGSDAIYFGALPAGGPIVPAPFPGVIRWEYPYVNARDTATMPATTVIQPTPGVTPAPLDLPTATQPAVLPSATEPATTPGLR